MGLGGWGASCTTPKPHLEAFQEIANANGGARAAGRSGHDQSAAYVYSKVQATGYYNVSYQTFDFPFFQELASALDRVSPDPTSFVNGSDYLVMTFSGNGDVTAPVQAVDLLIPSPGGSTSGCEAADFTGFTAGRIALVQRGTCLFRDKALNAQAAGAAGVVIFNEGNTADRTGLFGGTLVGPGVNIPVVSISYPLGVELNGQIPSGLTMHLMVSAISETRTTRNVIAETKAGRTDRVVVVGAHLDSVPEGPGINDNGSGSAMNLEIALQLAGLGIQPTNQVRFIWFSAEEEGLLGSQFYVDQLSTRQIKDIAVMLNFDMVASPNFVRFVYDGDGSATPLAGPNGSGVTEDIFTDYFAGQGLQTAPTAFDGRSDYGPFIGVGIPAGGLFTGAEGIKTAQQAAVYGGTAGVAYDACYHQPCDTIANINQLVLDQMADATAHTVFALAMTTSAVNGTDKGNANGLLSQLDFLGPSAQR